MYRNRTYRNLVRPDRLVSFRVTVDETDLLIHASSQLEETAKKSILKHRGYIEGFIKQHPEFLTALHPLKIREPSPAIIRDMADAGAKAGVGPMAAVAGAIAENVGLDLLSSSEEIIVENGGDIFIKTNQPITVGIFAGDSLLSMRIGMRIKNRAAPAAVCTSSGTIGHSLSLGKTDAVSVFADSCFLADAAATSIGNRINSANDIRSGIEFGKTINGIRGLIIIIKDKTGIWGDLEVVKI
jgi:ApbE superfamily uncharacterized protein (UPF0280 family)